MWQVVTSSLKISRQITHCSPCGMGSLENTHALDQALSQAILWKFYESYSTFRPSAGHCVPLVTMDEAAKLQLLVKWRRSLLCLTSKTKTKISKHPLVQAFASCLHRDTYSFGQLDRVGYPTEASYGRGTCSNSIIGKPSVWLSKMNCYRLWVLSTSLQLTKFSNIVDAALVSSSWRKSKQIKTLPTATAMNMSPIFVNLFKFKPSSNQYKWTFWSLWKSHLNCCLDFGPWSNFCLCLAEQLPHQAKLRGRTDEANGNAYGFEELHKLGLNRL